MFVPSMFTSYRQERKKHLTSILHAVMVRKFDKVQHATNLHQVPVSATEWFLQPSQIPTTLQCVVVCFFSMIPIQVRLLNNLEDKRKEKEKALSRLFGRVFERGGGGDIMPDIESQVMIGQRAQVSCYGDNVLLLCILLE